MTIVRKNVEEIIYKDPQPSHETILVRNSIRRKGFSSKYSKSSTQNPECIRILKEKTGKAINSLHVL